jgi:hypothetical protein
MKTCSICKEEKLFSEFYKDKTRKDGFDYNCKSCIRKHREINKIEIVAKRITYEKANKDKIISYRKRHYQKYPEKYIIKVAKRKACKLNATPNWLTREDILQIEELFICARMFKLYTGQEYHVDHIVPLQGENVCGLHVPWNLQVILASENLCKSNKLLQ